MALSKSRNRRYRTAPLALLLPSLGDRPTTMAEFDRLMAEQGIPEQSRSALRRGFRDGGVVFFLADVRRFATRTAVITQDAMVSAYSQSLDGVRRELREWGRLLVAGDIDLSEFQRRAQKEIEDCVWDAALLLLGPLLFTVPAVVNSVLEMIRMQLTWLQGLVNDIATGRQRLDGTLLRRIAMYAGGGWSALQELARQVAFMDGLREERNILGNAEHCEGCIRETGQGWVPIGTLVPVGERTCLSNCRCYLIYR